MKIRTGRIIDVKKFRFLIHEKSQIKGKDRNLGICQVLFRLWKYVSFISDKPFVVIHLFDILTPHSFQLYSVISVK